jgi:hypothetical protein
MNQRQPFIAHVQPPCGDTFTCQNKQVLENIKIISAALWSSRKLTELPWRREEQSKPEATVQPNLEVHLLS